VHIEEQRRPAPLPRATISSSLERWSDAASGPLIYAMLIFSPWAFGTTQPWSIWTMNIAGYFLGALLLLKWGVRFAGRSARRGSAPVAEPGRPRPKRAWFAIALGGLTLLILLYCLVAAANARATYFYGDSRFEYHDFIGWLPHSYDSRRSWLLFWNYLALAASFWAVRDWLGCGRISPVERENALFSRRWKRLLWVIALNGGLLALEGILQRVDGTGKLLWLVEPRVHKDGVSQFGPYAYRSNGAQWLNLIWPVAVGFWWHLQRATERGSKRRSAHHLLLPCAMLMAAGSMLSLSRGGALVTVACLGASLLLLFVAQWKKGWKISAAVLLLAGAAVGLGAFVNWGEFSGRFRTVLTDDLSGRPQTYRLAREMARDYPLFGTGPNTFDPVSQLYRQSSDQYWAVQVHDDWLETRATFGWAGGALIWLALLLVWVRPLVRFNGIRMPWVFVAFVWIALGGCLIHARFDFPFQIYSILFLSLVLCALLSSVSARR